MDDMNQDSDMRNMILSELIDKMHGRMADKMFPDAPATDMPADMPKEGDAMPDAHVDAIAVMPDDKGDDSDDMSDEDIDEILKGI